MNKLPRAARAQLLGMMAEGVSLRSITRMTEVSKNTSAKLLADAGRAFSDYQDRLMRDLPCKRLQLDEIWSFVYAKQKNVATAKRAPEGAGDVWTWTALDADTKLVPSWHVGSRDADAAQVFIADLQKPVRDASSHCRRHTQLRVNADEVVIHHVQRDRIDVVLDLLGEGVGQAGKAAHVQAGAFGEMDPGSSPG